jgi:hypothetical protein
MLQTCVEETRRSWTASEWREHQILKLEIPAIEEHRCSNSGSVREKSALDLAAVSGRMSKIEYSQMKAEWAVYKGVYSISNWLKYLEV